MSLFHQGWWRPLSRSSFGDDSSARPTDNCPPGVALLSIVHPRTGESGGGPRVGQLEPTTAAGGSAPGVVTVVRSVDGHGHVLPPASPPIEHPRPDKHNKRSQEHYPRVHRGLHRPPQCARPGPFASIAESPYRQAPHHTRASLRTPRSGRQRQVDAVACGSQRHR